MIFPSSNNGGAPRCEDEGIKSGNYFFGKLGKLADWRLKIESIIGI